MVIIGLCGKRQSGKDTFAKFGSAHAFKSNKTAAITSFASPIKRFVHDYCGVPIRNLDGTNEDKDQTVGTWGEFFSKEILVKYDKSSDSSVSGRELLQVYGTDVLRGANPNFWVDLLETRIKRNDFDKYLGTERPDYVFITDVRFQNEVEKISNMGGVVIKLDRAQFTDSHASEAAIDTIPEELFKAVYRREDIDGLDVLGQVVEQELSKY